MARAKHFSRSPVFTQGVPPVASAKARSVICFCIPRRMNAHRRTKRLTGQRPRRAAPYVVVRTRRSHTASVQPGHIHRYTAMSADSSARHVSLVLFHHVGAHARKRLRMSIMNGKPPLAQIIVCVPEWPRRHAQSGSSPSVSCELDLQIQIRTRQRFRVVYKLRDQLCLGRGILTIAGQVDAP